jgi:hypothetical protein
MFHIDVGSGLSTAVGASRRRDIGRMVEVTGYGIAIPNSHLAVTAWTANGLRITDLEWENRSIMFQSDKRHRSLFYFSDN